MARPLSRRQFFKNAGLASACSVGLPLLGGCRKGEPTGPAVVTYWEKWTGFEAESIQKVVETFNASHERVEVEVFTTSQIQRKVLMATAGGIPPDVAGLMCSEVVPYADKNALLPLDEYARAAGITSEDYIARYWDLCHHRGHLWALPSTVTSIALHWNKRLFREAGLDPERPPETIEELDDCAERLTRRDADGSITQIGFMPAEPGWWPWAWGYFFGGRLWNGEDRITATAPENVRAYEWIRAYADRLDVKQLQVFASGFGSFASPQNPFLSEIVAMELQGVWMHNFVANYAPDLEWGAAPFPYPADRPDLKGSAPVECDVLVVPRGAKHPDQAFEFIAFVASRQGSELLATGHRIFTPLVEVSPSFLAEHPNPYIEVFIGLAKSDNAFVEPQMPLWQAYAAELGTAFDQVWLGERTPLEALEAVQQRMQRQLDRDLRRYERMGLQYGE
jgi:multiple sugar transport system substrate-binding protein